MSRAEVEGLFVIDKTDLPLLEVRALVVHLHTCHAFFSGLSTPIHYYH
jgi:hypothetical protein